MQHAIANNVGTVTKRKNIISNGVLGMIIFIFTEAMFFVSLVSAYLIIRSNEVVWPPWGQPRLPAMTTGFNTAVLLLSGILLIMAYKSFGHKDRFKATKGLFGLSILLGGFFVLFQGYEWVNLIQYGLTMTSSLYGSLFYLIIGLHAVHAVGAILGLCYTYLRYRSSDQNQVSASEFGTVLSFWMFVVGLWPLLYLLVYLM